MAVLCTFWAGSSENAFYIFQLPFFCLRPALKAKRQQKSMAVALKAICHAPNSLIRLSHQTTVTPASPSGGWCYVSVKCVLLY